MGLDMYVYRVKGLDPAAPAVDVELDDLDGPQFYYWRKHPNLHGWFRREYDKLGGKDHAFNGGTLVITPEMLSRLEDDVKSRALPPTTGFFFGTSTPEDDEHTLKFIYKARLAHAEGYALVYTSWW